MTSPTTPSAAHIAWRLNMSYGLALAAATCDDADSTITRPSMTNIATTTAIT